MSETEGKSEPTEAAAASPPEASKKAAASSSAEKENKKTPRRRSSGGGGTYAQYIHDAIVALKDRTGSSQPAISKYILSQHPELECAHFKSRLNQALKAGVKNQRFTKIKSSFKVSAEWKAKEKNKKRRDKARKAAAADKKKAAAKKPKTLQEIQEQNAKRLAEMEQTLSPEALSKAKQRMAKQEEAIRTREEAARQAKDRADRLRKRRFPMEDTKLHAEDKELGVKAPPDVTSRPYLPYFWNITLPRHHPARAGGKTPSAILDKSKCEELDFGSRGLVSDMLQVYHFFRGDVHFVGDDEEHPVVPPFTLQHLMFAVEQIINGNAKKARAVPPLICHLFCTCLQLLCRSDEEDGFSTATASPAQRQLQKDLAKHLLPALSPSSWADVCFLYMDAMHRYATTDVSVDKSIVGPLHTDLNYLLYLQDKAVPMTPAVPSRNGGADSTEMEDMPLPAGYHGYLGDERGSLHKAYSKLSRHDPWLLTAEELMALLRALTDDVLASHPGIAEDIAARGEEMQQLAREKRLADAKFRKVRLAYEGPKKAAVKKAPTTTEDSASGGKDKPEEPFKPTATKKQFEVAGKAQQKANDAYEKGIRKLISRTEPVGYDRNFNAVYCFRHDPEVLYVEDLRPPSGIASDLPMEMQMNRRSWHVIETTSLFDIFVSSLDVRGRREHDLYEELLGPAGTQQSLRRYLHDDVKERAANRAQLREMEDLKAKMENAQKKCDEESRRSGRLAGKAIGELDAIRTEIEVLEKKISGEAVPETRDYEELTGLTLLRTFDAASGGIQTRRTRERKQARIFAAMPCSQLCDDGSGNAYRTGLIGLLVAEILKVERQCNSLMPWERTDMTRSSWITKLESSVNAWDNISPMVLGSPDASRRDSLDSSATPRRDSLGGSLSSVPDRKRRKQEATPDSVTSNTTSNVHSVSQIITLLKLPLLDLEARVADITNVEAAARDVDMADDNMSLESDENETKLRELAWKRIVHKIRNTPAKCHVRIREMVVASIDAARKTHNVELVKQLREALLQYHPSAAGDCKAAAVKVLVAHGDYDPSEDDYDEDDDEEEAGEEAEPEEELPSVLSAEGAILASSLDGSDDATRLDWIQAVKDCKTISRLAALTTAFLQKSKEKLEKLSDKRDALVDAVEKWTKEEERRVKNRATKKGGSTRPPKETVGPSKVWANVTITDEICMAKAEEYPVWPAKKCAVKDPELAQSLRTLERSLVSLLGEMGDLRVVKNENIQPFTGEAIETGEQLAEYSRDVVIELGECLTMAKRIQRGLQKKGLK